MPRSLTPAALAPVTGAKDRTTRAAAAASSVSPEAPLTEGVLGLAGSERHTWQDRAMGIAPKILALYVFLLFSRLFEASLLFGFGNLYLMLIMSSIALLVIFLGGDFLRAAATPAGLLLLIFTFWAVLIMPFSSWRSESLHVFTSIWIKSLAAFFIIAGLSRSIDHARKVFTAIGLGAMVSLLLVVLPGHDTGDRFASFGSMGNANEVAFHLMLGLPFLVFLISRVKFVWKIPLAVACLLSVIYALKTVSRAGIIIGVVLFLVAFFQVSFANKIKILFIAVAGAAIGVLLLDQTSLSRYETLIHPGMASDEATLSALESSETRKHELELSLELTVTHPVFGIGMGDFISAAADLATVKGERALWIASHNSYTQISSETGLPGFFLLFGVFITCYVRLIRLSRASRRLGLQELHSMALCALLALIALSIHFFFDAIAWDYYLPMISGLCMTLVFSAKPLIAKAEAAANRGESAESGAVEAIFTEEPTVLSHSTAAVLVPGGSPVSPRPRNPYRLGRRRG